MGCFFHERNAAERHFVLLSFRCADPRHSSFSQRVWSPQDVREYSAVLMLMWIPQAVLVITDRAVTHSNNIDGLIVWFGGFTFYISTVILRGINNIYDVPGIWYTTYTGRYTPVCTRILGNISITTMAPIYEWYYEYSSILFYTRSYSVIVVCCSFFCTRTYDGYIVQTVSNVWLARITYGRRHNTTRAAALESVELLGVVLIDCCCCCVYVWYMHIYMNRKWVVQIWNHTTSSSSGSYR